MDERELLDRIWPCRGWFCRLVARRILGYFLSKSIVRVVSEKSTVEGGVAVSTPEVDLVKEIRELKNTVGELKSAIAEIRAALADLTGPFSYYKPPVEEKREAQVAPAPSQQAPQFTQVTTTPVQGAPEKPAPREEKGLVSIERVIPALEEASRVIREEKERIAGVSLRKVLGLMRALYEVRRFYPKANVEDVVNLLERLSIINENEASTLRVTMSIVENSLKENITPEENALLMYLVLRNLGIRDEVLEEEILRIVMNSLSEMRRKARGGQESPGGGGGSEGGSDKWESQPQ